MTDFARFEEALKNAHDAGDVEAAAALATEMRRQMKRSNPSLGIPDPVKLGQENMPQSMRDVAAETGVATQRLAGIGAGVALPIEATQQLLGAKNDTEVKNWQAVSGASPNTQMGTVAGAGLSMAPLPFSGLSTGLRMAGAKALPRWGQVADTAATQGGIAAATTPGDASERLLSGALGVGGGLIAPGAVASGQTTRRVATDQGRQLGLAEALRREVGDKSEQLITGLENNRYPTAGHGVKPSAGMLTGDPTLQVMESGSRTRTADQWANFDKANADARWRALEEHAGTPEEVQRLRGARDAITGPMREQALGRMGGVFYDTGRKLEPLTQTLDSMATGAARPNKDVQTLVSYVKGEIEKGATPDQLYTVRKMLTDGIKAGPTSELSQAARAARVERMEIIGKIDQVLDDMSEGSWKKYLETYKISSPLITSKQSMQNIVEALRAGRPAGETPASMGERPSSFALGKLLDRFGSKDFGSKSFDQLIPQHRQLAEAIISDLKSQGDSMLPRGIIGSPTASNLANAGRVSQLANTAIDAAGNAVPFAGGVVAASVKGGLARRNEEALAALLKDPAALAKALRDADSADKLLKGSSRAGAVGGAAYRSQRE